MGGATFLRNHFMHGALFLRNTYVNDVFIPKAACAVFQGNH